MSNQRLDKAIDKAIAKYGFLITLLLLKDEEKKENYSFCESLKKGLIRAKKGRASYLSEKTDPNSIEKIRDYMKNPHSSQGLYDDKKKVEELKEELKLDLINTILGGKIKGKES